MIVNLIKSKIPIDDILLVTSNLDSKTSSDIDIYCIVKEKSFVHILKNPNDGRMVEIFADTIKDFKQKIKNVDEIAINFINEMDYVYGDVLLYKKLKKMCFTKINNYKLPQQRKKILEYRIHVLFSKYKYANQKNDLLLTNFFLSALTYPLIQIILEKHKIFPSSPKKWVDQLKNGLPKKEFKKINLFLSREKIPSFYLVKSLYQFYVKPLKKLILDKSNNNKNTFIN